MVEQSHPRNFVIISPAQDEARYVERTIQSVLGQSVRPFRWIIVDDGSRDSTPQILTRYSKQYSWITVLTVPRDSERKPGSAEIIAFMAGYRLIEKDPIDFVAQFDWYLNIPSEYFETI